jgi:hypothetical protein
MSAETTAFISHAAEDEAAAIRLKEQLGAGGIRCWCFEEDLRFSDHIETRVKEAIAESDWLIVVLSPSVWDSDWVRWELGFAKMLHQERGGVERPIILAVHDYEQFPANCELQPFRFGTTESIGSPLPFDRHRCVRLRDASQISVLSRHMKPNLTRIVEPRGRHEQLFEGVAALLVELFPEELDRPDIDEIREWLESSLYRVGDLDWPELIIVSHYGDQVTGFLHLNYSLKSEFAYGPFLGISQAWRSRTTLQQLVERGRSELVALNSECRGVLFQVEPFDESLLNSGGDEHAWNEHEIAKLRRVNLFQTLGAFLLLDQSDKPIRIPQWSLKPPLGPETEVEHFLMFLPTSHGTIPAFDDQMIKTYLSLGEAGFGPEGVGIPGYLEYLVDFESRLRSGLPMFTKFGKLYFSREMRRAIRSG